MLEDKKLDKAKIGFMQGRLSPCVDDKIQAFPWDCWREEFEAAQQNGFHLMEWTIDQDRLYENPLMTEEGRQEIKALMQNCNVNIPSLTADCLMQAPFYKTSGEEAEQLLEDFENILKNSVKLGIKHVLVPLVDNGRVENEEQEKRLLHGLERIVPLLEQIGVIVTFESDFSPEKFSDFISKFDSRYFGINYDIGDSAYLGYNGDEVIGAYGKRVVNVHIKDLIFGGATVPLGTGDADIPGALNLLQRIDYSGNFILQPARAKDDSHVGLLCRYRDMVLNWMDQKEKE